MALQRITYAVVLLLTVTALPASVAAAGPYLNGSIQTSVDGPTLAPSHNRAAAITLVEDVTDKDSGEDSRTDTSAQNKKKPGKHGKVLELKRAIIELQNRGKLGFRKVVLCSKVESYGVYSPLPKGKLARTMVLYCEPANVSTMVTSDRYIVDCTVDFIVLNAAGKAIAGKKGYAKLHRIARSPVLDLFFGLKFKIDKKVETLLKPGFTLRVLLHDNIKNQSAAYNLKLKRGKKPQDPV